MITGLEFVNLYSKDPTAQGDFYINHWGLIESKSEAGNLYLRGLNKNGYLLGLIKHEESGIERIGFGVSDRLALEVLAQSFTERGVKLSANPSPMAEGYGFSLRDPDNRELVFVTERPTLEHELILEKDTQVAVQRLSHIVVNTPDMANTLAFYTQKLGFKVSDKLVIPGIKLDLMYFLRCNRLHHTVALARGRHPSLNHLAYELPDEAYWRQAVARLKNQYNLKPGWGPGRFNPAKSYFAYYLDPQGYVCEYASELELIENEREPITYTPKNSELWRNSKPTVQLLRALQGETGFAATLRSWLITKFVM